MKKHRQFGAICVLVLMMISTKAYCAYNALEIDIALQLSSFFNNAPNQVRRYCLMREDYEHLQMQEIENITKNIKPQLTIKIVDDNLDQNECWSVYIDNSSIYKLEKLAKSKAFQSSIIVANGEFSLNYGADIAIYKVGNHYDIGVNTRTLTMKGIKVHPQLLEIAKLVKE